MRYRDRRAHRASACLLSLVLLTAACGRGPGSDTDRDGPEVAEKAVSFATSDGVELTGRLFGEGRTGIVLSHMYPADARSWYRSAKVFAAAGYLTLAYNFRGYADSEGERSPSRSVLDVQAAVAALRNQGARDIALVGASMGGTASLVSAVDRVPLAVVAISAPARFQTLDAIAIAQNIQRPVLLMASRGDSAAFDALQDLGRALPNPDTKIYDGEAHGTALLDDRAGSVEEIVDFLERYAPSDGVPETPEA